MQIYQKIIYFNINFGKNFNKLFFFKLRNEIFFFKYLPPYEGLYHQTSIHHTIGRTKLLVTEPPSTTTVSYECAHAKRIV